MKNYMFRIISIFTAVVFVVCIDGCQNKTQDVEMIIIRNYVREIYYEDRVDFLHMIYERAGPLSTSVLAKDNNYIFVCDLCEKKTTEFFRAVKKSRLLFWEDEYLPEHEIYDGLQWEIIIMFTDSTKKVIYGDNSYPDTWNKMAEAFEELTNHIIINRVN